MADINGYIVMKNMKMQWDAGGYLTTPQGFHHMDESRTPIQKEVVSEENLPVIKIS